MNEDLTHKTLFELICMLNSINIEEDKLGIQTIELKKRKLLVIRELCRRIPSLEYDENINPKRR